MWALRSAAWQVGHRQCRACVRRYTETDAKERQATNEVFVFKDGGWQKRDTPGAPRVKGQAALMRNAMRTLGACILLRCGFTS